MPSFSGRGRTSDMASNPSIPEASLRAPKRAAQGGRVKQDWNYLVEDKVWVMNSRTSACKACKDGWWMYIM